MPALTQPQKRLREDLIKEIRVKLARKVPVPVILKWVMSESEYRGRAYTLNGARSLVYEAQVKGPLEESA